MMSATLMPFRFHHKANAPIHVTATPATQASRVTRFSTGNNQRIVVRRTTQIQTRFANLVAMGLTRSLEWMPALAATKAAHAA